MLASTNTLRLTPFRSILPRNEHGNIEIPEGAAVFVPLGCQHITNDCAAAAASKLGLQAVPAMVGFESRQGRQIPKISGVVVLEVRSH